MYDIITIGSATRDVLLEEGDVELRKHADSETGVEQCLPLGSKLEIKKIVFTTGGGGTNAAVTFARQGFKTAFIGTVGDDKDGQEIEEMLENEGIDARYLQKHDDDHTAYSVILVHANGERTILSYKGEGQHFAVGRVPFDRLSAKWFYLSSLGGNFDLLEKAVNRAVQTNAKIATNPGGKELAHGWEKLLPILKQIDIFTANREEGALLTGIPAENWEGILRKLKTAIKGAVVITDGHNGLKAMDEMGILYTAGVPDSPVVERTGAGDAFASGLVAEYIRSGDIKRAIQFGTANASSVVTQYGGKAGILAKDKWGDWPLIDVNQVG